ncbi:MAG: response regulator [Thermoanaerobaculia bacterium]
MNQRPRPVLVVDDDEMIRNLVRTILHRHSFEVETAADGEVALSMVHGREYAVVLLDLMMPRMDGITFLQHVAEEIPTGERPMILVMTAATDGLIRQLEPSLVQGVVRKPFDISELAAVVAECAARTD